MNIITIIALACLVALGCFWLKKSALKGIKPRSWPAFGEPGDKPKLI